MDYDDEEIDDLTDRDVYITVWLKVYDLTHSLSDAIGAAGVTLRALKKAEQEPIVG